MIAITNRTLCTGDYMERIRSLACDSRIRAIILREKDLPEKEYERLAEQVLTTCVEYHKKCVLHSFPEVAVRLQHPALHLPLSLLRERAGTLGAFTTLGTSVHSVEEAGEAEKLGATYLIAGHIFDTDCKKGLPGRGIPFLREVCESVSVPVYAIGGITPDCMPEVLAAGARDGCSMSGCMRNDFL